MFSQTLNTESAYCPPSLGQYFTYPEDGVGWEDADLASPTWSTAYTLSPVSASSQTFSPPIITSGNLFENSFAEANGTCFSDPTLPWTLSEEDTLLFPPAKEGDYPAIIPSPVADSPTYKTTSIPEEPETVSKSIEYKPAWITKSIEKRTPKRVKSSARSSQASNSKSSRASSSDSDSGSNSRGRRNHNLTEKKYRNRLNGQFETLLQALPPAESVDALPGSDAHHEKRISKAEVLILAKEHIEALEKKRIKLESERMELTKGMEQLKSAWASMGGEMMP